MTDKQNFNKSTVRKILLFAFSVLCALLLWVYVTSTEGDEHTESFPGVKVVFEGDTELRDTKGLIVTSLDTTSVRVSVTGSRRTVSKLSASEITAVIDLTNISASGNYTLSPKISLPEGTDKNGVTATATLPALVSFYVDKYDTKPIPVYGAFNGSTAEGYSAEALQFSPETVKITGPEKALADVSYAWIENDRSDVDKTLTFESTYVLMSVTGEIIENDEIELVTDTVSVTLPVTAIKDVDLTLSIIPGGGATESNIKYSIDPAVITLSGDSETLDGINSISLDTIDLAELEDGFIKDYPIVIPNDTKVIGGTKEATVTLEIKGLATKKLIVAATNFSCINVSEGKKATIYDNSLEVTIRGTSSVLEDISSNNIRAVADLTEFGTATGVFNPSVKIYIDGTTAAGAVGKYNLYVNVQAK